MLVCASGLSNNSAKIVCRLDIESSNLSASVADMAEWFMREIADLFDSGSTPDISFHHVNDENVSRQISRHFV